MQSNLYSEDSLLSYWNEFDGGPVSYPLPQQHPPPMIVGTQFDNGSFSFLPPPPPPVGMPYPAGLMVPGTCPNPMMGPVPRTYPRFQPALASLQAMQPGSLPQPPPPIIPATHFNFQPPQSHFPISVPPVPVPVSADNQERTHLNHLGQMEQVVVKNGQVFHISFIDDPSEPEPPALPTHNSENTESEDSQSRDWINYDELPLLQNIFNSETENGTYKCKQCGKELVSALNLYIHEQTHKTTRLDCKVCGKRFNRIGKLEHHIRKHHLETLPEGSASGNSPSGTPILNDFSNYCVECEEFFTSGDELQNHMEVNHRLIDDSKSPKDLKKAIGCPYCEETFEWPCLLKTHMTKHTGEKPFICERCNVSFRFVQSFYRHNRRVHGCEK
ncbi:zinc finger protein 44-like [Topomyia yanbarensis]|uniref:zinc finger protein 44-like n=1 Tax=Topomyia yanbarensis TaxID=2498891 RepID=UPI00273B5E84|nr:zinc finger protein 44-like [Topomyia yanbarensis]XP_058831384.1 zinc finger protein 44-like [Topomyia yanbarensis]